MDLNEKIIECVREHVCLYEPSNKHYKNAVLKARLWKSIAEKLNETSDTIKRRWKSMRDGYMKYKKQVKGTTGCERKTVNFVWSAQLSFLDSSISPRETASNISEGSRIETYENSDSLSSTLTTSSTNPEQIPTYEPLTNSVPRTASPTPGTSSNPSTLLPLSTPSGPTATPRRTNKRIAEPDVDSMIVNYLNNKKEKPTHDSIDYLFLSYADTFKKLSHRKQAMLKVDLAKLFSEAELSEMPTEYAYSPTYSIISNATNVFSDDTTNISSDNATQFHTDNATYINSENTTNTNMPQDLTYTLLTDLPSQSLHLSDYSTTNK